MQNKIEAAILARAWRKIDIKLNIDGEMHILRWRRGVFADQVLFDDRRIAQATGLWGRETVFGLAMRLENDDELRLLFSVDPNADERDWSGDMRPSGVRLETADTPLIAYGTLGPDRSEPFRTLYDRAIRALGLA